MERLIAQIIIGVVIYVICGATTYTTGLVVLMKSVKNHVFVALVMNARHVMIEIDGLFLRMVGP